MNHPFTPTYISMAKAAEEIQAMRSMGLTSGDYADCDLLGVFIWPLPSDAEEGDRHDSDPWLPRLDQLLGMLGAPRRAQESIIYAVEMNEPPFVEWHELAIASVMREKYGKVWRDGVWTTV